MTDIKALKSRLREKQNDLVKHLKQEEEATKTVKEEKEKELKLLKETGKINNFYIKIQS